MTMTAAAAGRYDAFARALHWTMALLLALAFALGLGVDAFPRAAEALVVQVHVLIGASLVILLGLRVAWRLTHGAPPAPAAGPLMERAARLGHLALYLMMAAVLAAGLATLFLRGEPIDAVVLSIPSPWAANRALARSAKEVHETLSFVLVGLSAVHVAAALWHHFVLRDGTLSRMAAPRADRSGTPGLGSTAG